MTSCQIIENSIEEHTELRSDSFTIEGYPGSGGFSVGEFQGTFKTQHTVVGQPASCRSKPNNAVENLWFAWRGKAVCQKGLLCQRLEQAVLVLNTLDVWPFTMGDSVGEGEDLIPRKKIAWSY